MFRLFAILALQGIVITSIKADNQEQEPTPDEIAPLQIHGSDFFDPWFPNFYESLQSAPTTEFNLTGSYSGLEALKRGYADGCFFINSWLNPITFPDNLEAQLVGYYVLYLYIDPSFISSHIRKETIAGIAQSGNQQKISHWDSVEAQSPTGWEAFQASVLIDESADSFASHFFRDAFLDGKKISNQVVVCSSESELSEKIDIRKGSLVVSPRADFSLPNFEGKILQLANFGDETAFLPTYENVAFGDYPAAFPIYFVQNKKEKKSSEFMDLLMDSKTKHLLKRHNILPAIED